MEAATVCRLFLGLGPRAILAFFVHVWVHLPCFPFLGQEVVETTHEEIEEEGEKTSEKGREKAGTRV